MTKCVLKNENGVMIKSIDTANTKLELTTDPKEAFNYVNGEWFAKSELEFLQFHYKEEYPDVTTMTVQWVSDSDKEEEKAFSYGIAAANVIQGAPIQEAEAPMDEDVAGVEMAAPQQNGFQINENVWDDLEIEVGDAEAAPW
jgi:hypothetical protein